MINMFNDLPVGFGLIFKVEDLFDLCYENVLVIFKHLTTAVDLCHVVYKDKFVDFTSFVTSVLGELSLVALNKQQILKLDDFLKLTIIHFSVRARRTNAAVLSCATFIATVHDILGVKFLPCSTINRVLHLTGLRTLSSSMPSHFL
ncbi:hypothetical protein Tco_0288021 [Tanacetum coccineum]